MIEKFYPPFRSVMSLEFRTTQPNGVIFYFSDPKHLDHIGITMTEGKIRFTFNGGSGSGVLLTPKAYNDGQWHKVWCFKNCLKWHYAQFLLQNFGCTCYIF